MVKRRNLHQRKKNPIKVSEEREKNINDGYLHYSYAFFTEQDVQTKKPMGAAKTTEKKVESSSEDSSDEGIVK